MNKKVGQELLLKRPLMRWLKPSASITKKSSSNSSFPPSWESTKDRLYLIRSPSLEKTEPGCASCKSSKHSEAFQIKRWINSKKGGRKETAAISRRPLPFKEDRSLL